MREWRQIRGIVSHISQELDATHLNNIGPVTGEMDSLPFIVYQHYYSGGPFHGNNRLVINRVGDLVMSFRKRDCTANLWRNRDWYTELGECLKFLHCVFHKLF